jgi:hypothetical protein
VLNWVLESTNKDALAGALLMDAVAAVLRSKRTELSPTALVGLFAEPSLMAVINGAKESLDPSVVSDVLDANDDEYVTEYARVLLTHAGMTRVGSAFIDSANTLAARAEGLVPVMLAHSQLPVQRWVADHVTSSLAGEGGALEAFCALAPEWAGTLDGLIATAQSLGT